VDLLDAVRPGAEVVIENVARADANRSRTRWVDSRKRRADWVRPEERVGRRHAQQGVAVGAKLGESQQTERTRPQGASLRASVTQRGEDGHSPKGKPECWRRDNLLRGDRFAARTFGRDSQYGADLAQR